MIIDTSSNLAASDLVKALRPSNNDGGGWLIARYDADKKVLRTKIPCDRASWFLEQVPPSRHLSVSSSTYQGSNLLPNFRSTRALSVFLDLKAFLKASSPQRLFEIVCTQLDSQGIPLPSAVAVSTTYAIVLWLVDQPFEFSELGCLYATEAGLISSLKTLGSVDFARSASQYIPLPRVTSVGGAPVALISNGDLKIISRNRLARSTANLVNLSEIETLTRNCEAIEELGQLLFSRSLDVYSRPELNAYWLAGYAAAISKFVDILEFKDIIRGTAESLETDWTNIKTKLVPNKAYTYESYLDRLVRYHKVGEVRLGVANQHSVNDEHWVKELGSLLMVTQDEADELQLKHVVPYGIQHSQSHSSTYKQKMPIGREDYVSLYDFLKAA